jgi:hypothetical protein
MQLLDGIEDKLIRGWAQLGYRMLQPPFFVVEPETSFANAWEVFCCQVLNRHHKTTDIYQRKPPEGGIDLYWPAKKLAYQCKSVEDKTGQFSLSKAMASIDSALKTRRELPWEKYILCANVVLTGEQERKLREQLPDKELELPTPSFWHPRFAWNSGSISGTASGSLPVQTNMGGSPSKRDSMVRAVSSRWNRRWRWIKAIGSAT